MINFTELAAKVASGQIKALSIKQPYPHYIFHDGKDVENRDCGAHSTRRGRRTGRPTSSRSSASTPCSTCSSRPTPPTDRTTAAADPRTRTPGHERA